MPLSVRLLEKSVCHSEKAYRAAADIPGIATLNHVVQGLHDLFHWSISIKAVSLQHVDISAQALHAPLDGVEDVLSRQADTINPWSVVDGESGCVDRSSGLVDVVEAFGEDDDVLARDVVFFEELAQDLLGRSVGVGICDVERADTTVISILEDRQCFRFGFDPGLPVGVPIGHTAKNDL